MVRSPIVPCLWFDHQAEEAAAFYTQAFPDGRVTARSRYPESFDNPGGKPRGSLLTVEFEVAGQRFTALNGGPHFAINPSISFFVHVDEEAEADRMFATLGQGGRVLMPLGTYPWSPRYGWTTDRFGVSWQVMAGRRTPGTPMIVPCLMFAGPVVGRAQEAIEVYGRIFPNAKVESIAHYEGGEGPQGAIQHARFTLVGQTFAAMDSHVSHDIAFNEGLSLQVMCDDQATVDRYWAALSEGGSEGPCGWLKDRFGLSWQVVPSAIASWMTSDDTRAKDRAFEAMLKMGKLDVAALDRAYHGLSAGPGAEP